MKRKYDLIGMRFGKLVAIEYIVGGKYKCRCDCGTIVPEVLGTDLRAKRKSCGCLKREAMHPMHNTSVHKSWEHAKGRTTCRTHKNWALYGGRGIVMCERWLNSFKAFYEDMGDKPSPKHSLDRIDSNGPYSPENCRWATWDEQRRNKRNNVRITIDGVTKIMADWARELGVPSETFRHRILRGDYPESWTVLQPTGKAARNYAQG